VGQGPEALVPVGVSYKKFIPQLEFIIIFSLPKLEFIPILKHDSSSFAGIPFI
jgi:hypothetical protein